MIEKEKWWDPNMSSQEMDEILSLALFKDIDAAKFPVQSSLSTIIYKHTRLLNYLEGEVIIRAGDYGNSAFLIVAGNVGVILPTTVPQGIFGTAVKQPTNWFKEIAKLWRNPSYPEVRPLKQTISDTVVIHTDDDRTRVFIQNFSSVVEQIQEVIINLSAGDMVGEIAALTRTPRTAHVIASSDCLLLEIRWQAIHALRKYNDEFRKRIDALYRKNSLDALRTLPIFSRLEKHEQDNLISHTLFESYGEFDWHENYKDEVDQDRSSLLKHETLIVDEGDYADGLLLINSGVARVSHHYNHGYRIIKYLNKGDGFGLRTIIHNWKNHDNSPLPVSLHAVGYTNVMRVPSHIIEALVLPRMTAEEIDILLVERKNTYLAKMDYTRELRLADGMLDFMSDFRYINGSASMLIDLDRCIRCDECVNACAVGHNNNPRFNRHGRRYDHFMVANACMHCHDPVCMIGCPTGAIYREPDGQVAINDNTCIGCSTCANSCPYENIKMVQVRNAEGEFRQDAMSLRQVVKASKCDLCVGQLDGPACQRACPHDALKRIDLFELSTLIKEVE